MPLTFVNIIVIIYNNALYPRLFLVRYHIINKRNKSDSDMTTLTHLLKHLLSIYFVSIIFLDTGK